MPTEQVLSHEYVLEHILLLEDDQAPAPRDSQPCAQFGHPSNFRWPFLSRLDSHHKSQTSAASPGHTCKGLTIRMRSTEGVDSMDR